MIKKKKSILIPIYVIVLATLLVGLCYKFFEYKSSMEYVDQSLPFYAQNKTTNKIIYTDSPKKIVQNILAGEEYFKGDLKLTYIDIDKAEITMRNYGTGDDSRDVVGYYVIVEKKQPGWKITQFKTHWKCSRGLYWPRFWTTSACL